MNELSQELLEFGPNVLLAAIDAMLTQRPIPGDAVLPLIELANEGYVVLNFRERHTKNGHRQLSIVGGQLTEKGERLIDELSRDA